MTCPSRFPSKESLLIRHLSTLVGIVTLEILFSNVAVQAAEPVRVGILGIDNFGSVASLVAMSTAVGS